MKECLCPLIHTVSILTYAQPLSPRPTGFAGKEHDMKRIITIGREFGSGGRELGRRIAEKLEIAYYDQEIITEIAKRTALSEEYVRRIEEKRPVMHFPIHTGHSIYLISEPTFYPDFPSTRNSMSCFANCPANPTASSSDAAQIIFSGNRSLCVFLLMQIWRAESNAAWSAVRRTSI